MSSAAEVQPAVPVEIEPPELIPRNITVGTQLVGAATLFVFLGPLFAYFYLRLLNSSGLWRPHNVNPPHTYGWVIMVLFAVSAVLLAAGALLYRQRGRGWLVPAALSLLVGLAGVVVQCVQYLHLSFGPMSGGYASVFIAWTALYALSALCTMVAVEMLLAYGLRHRSAADAELSPRLYSLAGYWGFLAALGVGMWVVLYAI